MKEIITMVKGYVDDLAHLMMSFVAIGAVSEVIFGSGILGMSPIQGRVSLDYTTTQVTPRSMPLGNASNNIEVDARATSTPWHASVRPYGAKTKHKISEGNLEQLATRLVIFF